VESRRKIDMKIRWGLLGCGRGRAKGGDGMG
jgi:hypothetical protein